MTMPVPSVAEQPEERLVVLEEVSGPERRASSRAVARGMSLVRDDKKGEAQTARIRDISATGIALLVVTQYPVGAILTIAPLGWRALQFLVAKVVHARQVEEGWLHGCEFTEQISTSELSQWHAYYCRQGL
jgi:hypothetical protein